MDSKNLKGVWKLKRFCITCIELIFKFCLSEFCFQISNLKSYLSNPSRIFKIEAMEAVLWLVKRVYLF